MDYQQHHNHYQKILSPYFPESSLGIAVDWLLKYRFDLKIVNERSSKLGDYTSPTGTEGKHRISINYSLKPYSFLITYTHEVAHLITWEKYRNRVKPHGEEWKSAFRFLMGELFRESVFPEEIAKALIRYLGNPAAASCTDENLQRVLKRFENKDNPAQIIHLEQLQPLSFFIYRKKLYLILEKNRKRWNCIGVKDQSLYHFSGVTEVDLPPAEWEEKLKIMRTSILEERKLWKSIESLPEDCIFLYNKKQYRKIGVREGKQMAKALATGYLYAFKAGTAVKIIAG